MNNYLTSELLPTHVSNWSVWIRSNWFFLQEQVSNEHSKVMNMSSIGRSVSSPGSIDSPTTQLSQGHSKSLCFTSVFLLFSFLQATQTLNFWTTAKAQFTTWTRTRQKRPKRQLDWNECILTRVTNAAPSEADPCQNTSQHHAPPTRWDIIKF